MLGKMRKWRPKIGHKCVICCAAAAVLLCLGSCMTSLRREYATDVSSSGSVIPGSYGRNPSSNYSTIRPESDITVHNGHRPTHALAPERIDDEAPPNLKRRKQVDNVFVVALCHGKLNGTEFDVGIKFDQTIVMIKSAVAMTSQHLTFILISDSDELYGNVAKELRSLLRVEDWRKLTLEFHKFLYPEGRLTMRESFKPCATARLFIPKLLDYDSIVYLDTDLIFLRPPEHLWHKFRTFQDREIVGMSQTRGWYNLQGYITFPWYGDTGLNSGVMLMNLSRIDQFPGGWTQTFLDTFDQYESQLVVGDQDLLNIVFHDRPEMVHEIGCEWNFSGLFCAFGRIPCMRAEKIGVCVLHGNANTYYFWHLEIVLKSWKNYTMGTPLKDLWNAMEAELLVTDPTDCPYVRNFAVILTRWANDNWGFGSSYQPRISPSRTQFAILIVLAVGILYWLSVRASESWFFSLLRLGLSRDYLTNKL